MNPCQVCNRAAHLTLCWTIAVCPACFGAWFTDCEPPIEHAKPETSHETGCIVWKARTREFFVARRTALKASGEFGAAQVAA